MAGLIKGQILKHLSKFTKNLSPDKINISTMKGEGDLSNLELDEVALMEVMDLPTWLRLTKAVCNRVAIKIQWTKLKTHPICIYLDEIVVEMETCSNPRDPSSSESMANLPPAGKYGFAERIVDGIHLSINSVIINFKAPAFQASIQMSRIFVTSKTPVWQNADLRLTRIKDDLRGEILIFKEMEWQTLRIEANALEGVHPNMATTPLRLIANQSKTRITIRKKLVDCSIIASRVQFHLDDLLWVLTDSQMRAAFLFANSLKEIIQKSSLKSKHMAAEKIQKQMSFNVTPGQQKATPKPTSKSQIAIAKLFDQHDVVETSYHVHTGRIDLHLCDDSAPEGDGYRRKVEGGAMQLTLHKLMFDHYPYHAAGTDRAHWLKYDENMMARQTWAADLLSLFREDVRRVRDVVANTPPTSPDRSHDQSHKSHDSKRGQGQNQGQGQTSRAQQAAQRLAAQTSITGTSKPTKLLESCSVVRLEDFTIYRVSTANDNKRNSPKKFATSDKKQLLLPPEMSCIHIEYTDYYFPEGIDYPDCQPQTTNKKKSSESPKEKSHEEKIDELLQALLPSPNLYVVVNPMRLTIDFLTIIWLNAFSLNMLATLDLPQSQETKFHVDTKIDALMPRIILSADTDIKGQADRPDGLQIQVSKVTMTNVRIEPKASFAELHNTIKSYECGKLFRKKEFPMEKTDLLALSDTFKHHLQRTDHAFLNKAIGDIVLGRPPSDELLSPKTADGLPRGLTYYNMDTNSLKMDAQKDIWCIAVDQFWMEFIGVPSSKNRPVPFVESFPLSVWISMPDQSPSSSKPPSVPASPRNSSPRTFGDHRILRDDPYDRGDQRMDQRHRRNSYHSSSPHSPSYSSHGSHTSDHWNRRRSPHRNSPMTDGHTESPRGSRRNSYHSDSPGRDSPTRRMRPDSPIRGREPWETIEGHQRNYDGHQSRDRGRDGHHHSPPLSDDSRHDLRPELPRQSGDVYGIVKIGAKVNVEINHYQFLFLLRLLESISKFQAELLDDTNYICKLQDIKVRQMVISVVVPECEVALVCPPLPEPPKEPSSRQDSLDLQEAGLLDPDLSSHRPIFQEMPYREPRLPYSNGIHGPSQVISKSYSDTEIVSNDSSNDLTALVENHNQNQAFGQPMVKYASSTLATGPTDSLGSHRPVSISVTGSDDSQEFSQPLYRAVSSEQVSKDSRKSGQFSKSFNNAWSNFSRFSEKVKQNVKKDLLDIDDEEFETVSVRSGDSDDEDFVVLKLQNQTEAPAFERHQAMSDTASVTDASNDQDDSFSTTPEKAQKLVSVVSFRCVNMEAVLQTRGEDMIVSATIDNIIPVEYGNVDLDKFQAKLAAGKEEDEVPKEREEVANPPIKIRYMVGPLAEELVPRGHDLGFLKVLVENLRLNLGMSSVTSLTELIEDEFIPEAMPMLIHNKSAFLKIVSDTLPAYNTSPGPVPLDLSVQDLVIWRGEDNIFHISAAANAVPFNREIHRVRDCGNFMSYSDFTLGMNDLSQQDKLLVNENSQLRQRVLSMEEELKKRPKNEWDTKVVKTLEHENDQLRRQLEKIAKLDSHAANEKLQREIDYLREHTPEKLQRENSRMHQDLQRCREDVLMYKEERESLLTAIRALQDDLATAEGQLRQKNS